MPSEEKLRQLVSQTSPFRKDFSLFPPHFLQKAETELLFSGRRVEVVLHICIF